MACLLALALAACQGNPAVPGRTTPPGTKGTKSPAPSAAPSGVASAGTPSATPLASPLGSPPPTIATASLLPAGSLAGRVLDLAGAPAVGVLVRAQVIANNSGGVIANNGGAIISNGGGSLVSNNSAGYRLLALEARTGADGRFALDLPAGQAFGVEAVQSEDLKAIQLGVTAAQAALELQLAPTGSIEGQVTAPEQPALTNFEGIDVFVPGTSYAAKTDSAGKFRLTGVPVGTFEVVASRESLGNARAAGVAVASRATTTVATLALSTQAPRITALSAPLLLAGGALTITGQNFGASTGKAVTVTIGGLSVGNVVRDDDTTIKVVVPATAPSGEVVVTVGGIASAPQPLTVLKRRAEPGVSTLAGGTSGYADGTGSGAAFSGLGGTVIAPDGTIYIADADNTAIRRMVGNVVSILLGPPRNSNDINSLPIYNPRDLAIDAAGRLLVLDDTKGVVRVTPAAVGTIPTVEPLFAIAPAAGSPMAIAVGPNDTLFVLYEDAGVARVQKADLKAASPVLVDFLGGGDDPDGVGPARSLDDPAGLEAAPDGGIWLSERRLGVVERYSAAGARTFVAGPGEENGEILDGQGPAATFAEPGALALGPDGTLYLVDAGFSTRLRSISPTGEVKTIAGGDSAGTAVDGPATSAVFGMVHGLAVDHYGNLIISDWDGERIRKLTFFDP